MDRGDDHPRACLPRTLNGRKCVSIKRILTGTPAAEAISRDALTDPQGFDEFLRVARASYA